MKNNLAKEWASKAEEDYKVSKILYDRSREELASTICFHAQQCVEKYLKALIVKRGFKPPKIHVLEDLLDIVESTELQTYEEEIAYLTPFSVGYRYPRQIATGEDAKKCLKILEKLRKILRKSLELSEK